MDLTCLQQLEQELLPKDNILSIEEWKEVINEEKAFLGSSVFPNLQQLFLAPCVFHQFL